jgi:hypothetical protein
MKIVKSRRITESQRAAITSYQHSEELVRP